LRDALGTQVAVHALYGAVARSAQDAALRLDPSGRRKLVVASAIAETSLTIPGVRFVVDSGLARRPIYDPVRGITRLETKPASRASIDQRRGRAGRTAPGDCIRLWRREEEGGRPAEDRPEILDADLAKLRLDMALWGALDRTGLPFLDPPPERAWDQAGRLLESLGALDSASAATPLGARMAKRPTHPRLAALLERANAGEESDAAWAAVLAGELNERGPLDGAERLRAALADRRHAKMLKTLHNRLLGRADAKPPPDVAVLVAICSTRSQTVSPSAKRMMANVRPTNWPRVCKLGLKSIIHWPVNRSCWCSILEAGETAAPLVCQRSAWPCR
jgi:ATP-dependent helicase HrpB